MKTYKVLRQHIGDREYLPGDMRTAKPTDVAHLVKAGVLSEAGENGGESRSAAASRKRAAAGGAAK